MEICDVRFLLTDFMTQHPPHTTTPLATAPFLDVCTAPTTRWPSNF